MDAGIEKVVESIQNSIPKVEWDFEGIHYFDEGPLTVQYLFVLDALNFCFWPGMLIRSLFLSFFFCIAFILSNMCLFWQGYESWFGDIPALLIPSVVSSFIVCLFLNFTFFIGYLSIWCSSAITSWIIAFVIYQS